MASGKLASVAVTASTNTTIYTVPASNVCALTINVCNRGSTVTTVRIALSSTTTPTDGEWIEYDFTIPANGVLERTGIILGAGQNIVVFTPSSNVSVVIFGIEEVA